MRATLHRLVILPKVKAIIAQRCIIDQVTVTDRKETVI